MQNRASMENVRNVLIPEIASALNTSFLLVEIEILDMEIDTTYSVAGTFKVVNIFNRVVSKSGKFSAVLNEKLNIVKLKITQDSK